MNTALFWAALGAGAGVQNQVQFHFKRTLFEESSAQTRAVLVGSSQTRAQIDENQLNVLLTNRLWTAELHYPGSQGFDLLLIERHLRAADPDWVICYLTEAYFYLGVAGESAPVFFGFDDLPTVIRQKMLGQIAPEKVGYGLLGDCLPAFRCREAFAQRLLGAEFTGLKQMQYDASLETDLRQRADAVARKFRNDESAETQKRAFETFVARCQEKNRRVLIIAGQFHPLLSERIPAGVRRDMELYLEGIQLRHSNVTVIGSEQFPEQDAADYDDLTHVNPAAQKRFTSALAVRLDAEMQKSRR